jgi:hypothetical protein
MHPVIAFTHLTKLFARLVLPSVVLLPPFALAQDNPSVPPNQLGQTDQSAPPKQEIPQLQTNPATQANLPNAPSSLITAKPHGQGKIPLEAVPHPQVTLVKTPLNSVGDTYRMFTSPVYIRGGDLKWTLPLAAATGVALSQDTHVAKDIVSHDPDFNNANNTVSNALVYSYIGGSATNVRCRTLEGQRPPARNRSAFRPSADRF